MQMREYECFFCKGAFSRAEISPAPDIDTRNVLCEECHVNWLANVEEALGFALEGKKPE